MRAVTYPQPLSGISLASQLRAWRLGWSSRRPELEITRPLTFVLEYTFFAGCCAGGASSMAHHVLEYFSYGIDSFILCAGLAPAWHRKRAWLFLAVSFGLADGAASFAGHIVGQEWTASSSLLSIIRPPLVAIYGVLVLAAAKRSRLIAIGPLGVVALALLSSLDNFVSGAIDVNAAHFQFEQAMTISFVTAEWRSPVVSWGRGSWSNGPFPRGRLPDQPQSRQP